jgi:hypothetical protein
VEHLLVGEHVSIAERWADKRGRIVERVFDQQEILLRFFLLRTSTKSTERFRLTGSPESFRV